MQERILRKKVVETQWASLPHTTECNFSYGKSTGKLQECIGCLTILPSRDFNGSMGDYLKPEDAGDKSPARLFIKDRKTGELVPAKSKEQNPFVMPVIYFLEEIANKADLKRPDPYRNPFLEHSYKGLYQRGSYGHEGAYFSFHRHDYAKVFNAMVNMRNELREKVRAQSDDWRKILSGQVAKSGTPLEL